MDFWVNPTWKNPWKGTAGGAQRVDTKKDANHKQEEDSSRPQKKKTRNLLTQRKKKTNNIFCLGANDQLDHDGPPLPYENFCSFEKKKKRRTPLFLSWRYATRLVSFYELPCRRC